MDQRGRPRSLLAGPGPVRVTRAYGNRGKMTVASMRSGQTTAARFHTPRFAVLFPRSWCTIVTVASFYPLAYRCLPSINNRAGNQFKNKRVLMEKIHQMKAERNREKALADQAAARKARSQAKKTRKDAKEAAKNAEDSK